MTTAKERRATETLEMQALSAQGMDMYAIGRRYGLHGSTVRLRLRGRANRVAFLVHLDPKDAADLDREIQARSSTRSAFLKSILLNAMDEGLIPQLLGET